MHVTTIQHGFPAAALEYDLPERLIATVPAQPRDSARMMVMRRSSSQIEHCHVHDLPEYLSPGDAMAFNTTAVAPARVIGKRPSTHGKVEGLFLGELPTVNGPPMWRVMLKAGGRLKPADHIDLLDGEDQTRNHRLELLHQQDGEWIAALHGAGSTAAALEAVGRTPLPPYIFKARGRQTIADQDDREWYQTVYADLKKRQSIAAPTAGLHFTPRVLQKLREGQVQRIDVTLHVGAGTFKPITAATLDQHRMHTEWFEVEQKSIEALQQTHQAGHRVIAVGTTSVRALESLPVPLPGASQMCGSVRGLTDLLIAPPYEFKHVDGMLTNFHLPRSTLLALVAAMIGLDRLKMVYREAIEHEYRFYSYGDAMLILP